MSHSVLMQLYEEEDRGWVTLYYNTAGVVQGNMQFWDHRYTFESCEVWSRGMYWSNECVMLKRWQAMLFDQTYKNVPPYDPYNNKGRKSER